MADSGNTITDSGANDLKVWNSGNGLSATQEDEAIKKAHDISAKKQSHYKNILNWDDQVSPNTIEDSYIGNDGNINSLNGFTVSSYIPAIEGRKYYHITKTMTSVFLGAYYDSNYTWIEYMQKHKPSPDGTAFIRINIHDNDIDDMLLFEERGVLEDLVYKKIAFIGDSITEGYPHDKLDENDIYLNVIKEKLNLEEVYNFGYSGTHLVGDHYGDGASRRYWEVNEDADAVIVYMGVNDYLHQVDTSPIGTATDTDDSTFYGGINVLIEGLTRRFFGKQILFVTPLHCNNDEDTNDLTGLTLKGYVDIIKERCEYYSIPYVDLFNEARVNPNLEFHYNTYTFDGLHPNKFGHRIIAEKIIKKLLLD